MNGPGGTPANRSLAWEGPVASLLEGRPIRGFRTRIPEDYAFFEGHFPSYPVLAGVVQLHELVLPCVRRERPGIGALRLLTGVKFPNRIRPGDTIEVRLAFLDGRPAGGSGAVSAPGAASAEAGAAPDAEVSFEIVRGDVTCSLGRLSFERSAGGAAP